MAEPSSYIADVLHRAGLGTSKQDLFCLHMPEAPAKCITVYDTPGEPPMSGTTYERPHVMVHVRGDVGGAGDISAQALARSVCETLHDRHGETFGGYTYVGVWLISGPFMVGKDQNGRTVFSMNFKIHRSK